jgi:hypothetical protein
MICIKARRVSGCFSATEWTLHLHDGCRVRTNIKPFPLEAQEILCQRVNCEA